MWHIEQYSALATVVGVVALPLAWLSLRSTWDSNRSSHMNTLFREFLRIEFDYFNSGKLPYEGEAWRSLRSYKMWVLEEIWIWTNHERQREMFLTVAAATSHRKLLDGWEETLKFHVRNRANQNDWNDFERNQNCYHEGFRAFVAEWHPKSPRCLDQSAAEPSG